MVDDTNLQASSEPLNENIDFTGLSVGCVIVSDNYWPSLNADTFAHHPSALKALTEYQDAYAALKKPRKLHSAHQLGLVDVELDFDDGSSRSFTVTPAQVWLVQLYI
jgi:hypothetical protein